MEPQKNPHSQKKKEVEEQQKSEKKWKNKVGGITLADFNCITKL